MPGLARDPAGVFGEEESESPWTAPMSFPEEIAAALAGLPEPLVPAVERFYERLLEKHGAPRADLLCGITNLVARSEFAARVLLREWQALDEGAALEAGDGGEVLAVLRRQLSEAGTDLGGAQALLRRERNRQLVRILWRETVHGIDVIESMQALTRLADELLGAAAECAERLLAHRHGVVRAADGSAVPMVIVGMGKLGGGELNFSSDIDLVLAYPADGESDGSRPLPAQRYFDRMARTLVALLDEATADGFVYRVDTRLRPFGDSGAPVVSFAALESYLLNHGRDWERYAWVKARTVGPEPPGDVKSDLFEELVLPFVYRRYLDFGVFASLREMHAMIAEQVKKRELADNVKLGPGGIREVEFIVQSLQIVRGGRRAELRTPSLLEALPQLVGDKGLEQAAPDELEAAYRFLRRLENAIQAIDDKQTHELPHDAVDRARLCFALGFDDWQALLGEFAQHRAAVSSQFTEIAFRQHDEQPDGKWRALEELWESHASVAAWQSALDTLGVAQAKEVAERVVRFRGRAGTRRIDTQSAERLQTFMPRLLELAADARRPARAVSRSLTVLESVLRRSAYIALLNENRLAAERLVRLCEKSAYIARELERYPVLLDELLQPSLKAGPLTRDVLEAELETRLPGERGGDEEQQMERLVQFQRANLFRVAVADFSGDLPIMKVSDSLTFLAEVVIERALGMAWDGLVARHGQPRFRADGRLRHAGFAVVAYGKLGGLELSYGSDLDVVFLHDSAGTEQMTDGERPLENSVFLSRLIRRLVHLLTTPTSTGALYEIDTRLRPSGRKGLLVTSIDAFERYQEENAWTWEHQALLRARAVAGSSRIAAEFGRIRAETLTTRVRQQTLADDVLAMRARMRSELDRSDASRFDLKQGEGGVGDIEFIVQYLVLREASAHPEVIEYSDNIRQLDALAACGAITPDTAAQLQEIYRRYRLRQHHLILNDEVPLIGPDEFRAERDAVTALWERIFAP